jgi:hypothetical protein
MLAGNREITLADQNDVEKQTDWTYPMFLLDSHGNPVAIDQLDPGNKLPRDKSPAEFYPEGRP